MLDSGRCHIETYASVRMPVRTSYVCPVVFDVSSTSQIAYVTITIITEDSANPYLFQQAHKSLAHKSQEGSALNLR